jgi:hypothetical protein
MRSWRTVNNRKRFHWRWIGGNYVRCSRRFGIIWHPEKCWNDELWPKGEGNE